MALTLVTSDLIHGLDYSKLTGTIPTWNQNTTGNAATSTLAAGATILATARNIGGVSFNGSAAINLPGVNAAGNQNTSGTAAGLSATLAVGSGGTGVTSITALKNVLDDETWTFANYAIFSGKVKVSDGGNATTPSLRVSSDTNGLSSPSTNQLNFITNSLTRLSISSGGAATFSANHIQGSDTLRLLAPNTILYLDAATDIVLRTNSTTERLRILSGGNVGIGTTSPDDVNGTNLSSHTNLQVFSTSNAAHIIANGGVNGSLLLNDSGASANSRLWRVMSDGGVFSINALNDATSVKSNALTISSGGDAEFKSVKGSGESLNVKILDSNTNYAQGTGGGLLFQGIFQNNGNIAGGGAIQISKVNSNNGDYSYDMDFYTRPLGSAITKRLTISSGGNMTLASGLSLFTQGPGRVYTHNVTLREQDNTAKFQIYSSGGGCVFYNGESNGAYYFYTNGSERMRITSGGDFHVGTTSNHGFHTINKSVAAGGNVFGISSTSTGYWTAIFGAVDQGSSNSAQTALFLRKRSSTGRSINAAGTINAGGNDYAEYMTKAVTDTIEKGDIVGINSSGLLTNVFSESISFVIKSTDPSYVGGDSWGNDLNETDLEIERAKVDRIAFSGQVPCNVTGASVGDYIIPVASSDGKITGEAVSDPTFEQYKISVGKVWKIMNNGNSWVAVKIG